MKKVYRVTQADSRLKAPRALGRYEGATMARALIKAARVWNLPVQTLKAELDVERSFPAIGKAGLVVVTRTGEDLVTHYSVTKAGTTAVERATAVELERLNERCEAESKQAKA